MRPMEELDNCLKLKERKDLLFFAELQNHRGWEGPQEIESNPPSKADTLQ